MKPRQVKPASLAGKPGCKKTKVAFALPLWLTAWLPVFFCFLYLLGNIPSAFASEQKPDKELVSLLKKTVNDSSSFNDRWDAEVWLLDISTRLKKYVKNPKKRFSMLKLIHQEATKAGLEPELVLSVIHVESLFDQYAISRVGAQGLMQVMPFWKKEIGRPEDNLTNVATNLRYGCTILKYYMNKEKGNLTRALARYNGSTGKTWYPEKVLNAWDKYWFVKHI
ncbi:MAG: hypothetical protein CSB48_02060 [Proteobacteria bacterium]|nr:MAG: hypothetical protein CSB48_02060 [Pseudomonadota bacterium]PIE40535.1 MAG: hypothetical protein CSA51_00255 [Gammaproteobacteria bacterium]